MAERAHPEHAGFKRRWFGLKRNPYRDRLFERYKFCNEYVRGKAIIDVPCGSGWGTSMLKGFSSCVGIDISAEAVAYAQSKYARPGVLDFKVGSMAELPVADGSLDIVLCLEGFEHVERDIGTAFLVESERVLKRGGLLIMTCPVLNEYGEDSGNPYHLCEYPEQELIAKLNERFRVLVMDRVKGPDGPEYRTVVQNIKGQRYLSRSK